MGKTKHHSAAHDDETWMAFFRRWHAGEDARALRGEAGAAHDTWTANAGRLGMRIRDLPGGHPAKRRAPRRTPSGRTTGSIRTVC